MHQGPVRPVYDVDEDHGEEQVEPLAHPVERWGHALPNGVVERLTVVGQLVQNGGLSLAPAFHALA